MGWLIALAVILGLAVLPLGISVHYDTDGPLARLIAGPVRITLYPRKPGKKPKATKQKPPQEKKTAKTQPAQKQKSGGSLTDFLPLIRLVVDFLGEFRRKLRVNNLVLYLTMAGGDPCDLAVNYGRAWAAVGNILPQLERFLVIKKRDVQVFCDFVSSETTVYLHLDLTITLGRLLALAVVHGIRILKEFLKIISLRKGGAVK